MDELKVINLEGKEYAVIDEIKNDNFFYVYFMNPNNFADFCIRKTTDDTREILIGLDNEVEFRYALNLFTQKNKETINN